MKKCSFCGIIVHDEFDVCPNCSSKVFTQVRLEELEGADPQEDHSSPEVPDDINKAGKQPSNRAEMTVFRIMEIIGGVSALLGVFFPFIRVAFLGTIIEKPFNELAPSAYIVFVVLAIIGLIGGIIGLHKLTAIIGVAYGVLLYFGTKDYFAEISSSEFGALAAKGIGFYFMVTGIVLMGLFGIISDRVMHRK